jgi:hypothetical protein
MRMVWASTATLLLTLLTCLPVPGEVRADEATLPDGRRLAGKLVQAPDGRLEFVPAQGAGRFRLDQVEHVRLADTALPPFRAATVYRVSLAKDQRLTAALQELDGQSLRLRTAWAARLSVPRQAVAAVVHRPGFVTLVEDDFEDGLKAWTVTGAAAVSERWQTSGRRSLVLAAPGQAAEFRLPAALEAGQFGVNFHDAGTRTGARTLVEAEFQGPAGPRRVGVVVAGEGPAYEVQPPGGGTPVRRTPGWHRLVLEFTDRSLLVCIDDAVLGFRPQEGPGGPLVRLRLSCAAGPASEPPPGAVAFDDFSVARAVDERPHRPADPDQDELWLLSGDQLFGSVARADGRSIDVRGRFGAQTYAWSEVRGLYLCRQSPPPQTTDGEHVRAWLRPGTGPELDQLEGVLRTLDDRRLVLRHALLGEVTIDRNRLHQLRGLFHGRRIELDNGFHRLGRPGGPAPPAPRPEDVSLRRTFRLDAVPAGAHLVVEVAHLKGPGDGIDEALRRGDLRALVVVNGRTMDYLNRHVDRALPEPRRLRLALPPSFLRAGDNVVELRLTPGHDHGRYEGCDVSGLLVEVPR